MTPEVLIQTKELRREFGETVAVRDMDLSVARGAVCALVGPNGAGKTTLLRMLAALLEPTSGTALVKGLDVRRSPREVHAMVGDLPDFFGLYEDLCAREYLDYFARAYRLYGVRRQRRIGEVLELVGLSDKLESPIGSLSRGMRQRLGIARTLIHDPPLLLLDEPASGLDPEARYALQKLFRDLSGMGKTLVVSSHILSELEDYCTHVAILQTGRLVASGAVVDVSRSLGRPRRVCLKVAGGWERAAAAIGASPLAGELSGGPQEGAFDFTGDDTALAGVLKRLVDAGVAVAAFGEQGGDIQDAYLALVKEEGS